MKYNYCAHALSTALSYFDLKLYIALHETDNRTEKINHDVRDTGAGLNWVDCLLGKFPV